MPILELPGSVIVDYTDSNETGNEEAPVVLYVAPWAGDISFLYPLIDKEISFFYRIVCVNMRSHGTSATPNFDPSYSYLSQGCDFALLMVSKHTFWNFKTRNLKLEAGTESISIAISQNFKIRYHINSSYGQSSMYNDTASLSRKYYLFNQYWSNSLAKVTESSRAVYGSDRVLERSLRS